MAVPTSINQQRLKNKGIKQSMSRKGNSMDNGMMEDMPMEPIEEETPKKKIPLVGIIGIAAAVIAIIVIVITIISKKRKAKKHKEDMDLLDEDDV